MNKAIARAAKRISDIVKTDTDFRRELEQIKRSVTKKELMIEFLNQRMAVDPDQLFRVLQLRSPLTSAVSK
mgnify:FL=1